MGKSKSPASLKKPSGLYAEFIAACNKAAAVMGLTRWCVGTELPLFGPCMPGVGRNWEGTWPKLRYSPKTR